VQHQEIAGTSQRFDLAREHLVEPHVVGRGGEQRRVSGERHGPQRGPLGFVADDVLGRDMLGVGGAATVAGKEQRAATPQGCFIPRRDRHHRLGLLGRDAPRQLGECPQSLLQAIGSHVRAPRAA
jgi:hypothetical protein